MSTLKVGALQGISASSDAITLANDGTCTANITNKPNRNLIINGAMQVAQRGTSSTSTSYQTVDRFAVNFDNTDEAPTQAQVTLSSNDTPYSSGFRYALKITNGNQTSGAGNSDYVQIVQKIEAQDIAQSGWNYTSSSSNITLSFWVKSSVAQTMYARLNAEDASRAFSFAFSATTSWTKITKTISGNSNLVFNNDNGTGIALYFIPFYGTSYTTSSHTNDAWITDDGSDQVTDMTTTWYTTNDATFEITGVQLEVGSVATDFEHRSFAQELELCKRYCQVLSAGGTYTRFALGYANSSTSVRWFNDLRPEMRATPSFAHSGSFGCQPGSSFSISDVSLETVTSSPQMAILNTSGNSGMSAGQAIALFATDANAKITFSSEL